MADRICRRADIFGRVQGVNYRAWCREQAERRGLAGWVQNQPDGSVRAQFVGPEAAVADMITACREGPRDARVDRVAVEDRAEVPAHSEFRINR